MITVACVNQGNYLGLGDLYVEAMRSMVARFMKQDHLFVCLKDEGEEKGWWAKIELFRPGRFFGRVLYLDLDTVVVGNLDELVEHKGIIDLIDWGWKTHTLCTSTMVWDAGEHEEVFTKFDSSVKKRFRGDQDWITELGGWAVLPAHLCRSYRYHSVVKPPAGCAVVAMHGSPKPHEIQFGWVPEAWH